MDFQLLRMYFRAAVLVPFYLSLALSFTFIIPRAIDLYFNISALLHDPAVEISLRLPFYSGIIGVFTLTGFLNLIPQIANKFLYSILAWMLPPFFCIAYIMSEEINWSVMSRAGSLEMLMATILILVCFFHTIGIIISFQDFRATIVINNKTDNR